MGGSDSELMVNKIAVQEMHSKR